MSKKAKARRQNRQNNRKRWTVMVYMAAGNTSELDAFAVRNLREMENGVNDSANVVVQINRAWPDTPQRYEIRPKASKGPRFSAQHGESVLKIPDDAEDIGLDMGDGVTLSQFLAWSVDHYPAEHYLLVLWGHSYGLGFGRDHNDPMTLSELSGALKAFQEYRARRGKTDNVPLEILGTNACAMSYAEAAYELRNGAKFMVASQITVPFAGWPYDAILKKITPETRPECLCQIIVNSYLSRLNTPLTGEQVDLTILHLPDATDLARNLNELALALEAELLRADDQLLRIRDIFLGSASGEVRPLIDLKDLCEALRALQRPRVTTAVDHVEDVLKKLIVPTSAAVDDCKFDGYPASSRGQTPVEPVSGLGGVGIFVPFVTDEGDLKRLELDDQASEKRRQRASAPSALRTGKATYFGLELFKGRKKWPRLMYDGLRQEIPEELLAFIESVGVTNNSDRIGVAQIIMSIESWFNRFDLMLKVAQQGIRADLEEAFVPGNAPPTYGVKKENAGNVFGPPSLKLVNPDKIGKKTSSLQKMQTVRTQAGGVLYPSGPASVTPADAATGPTGGDGDAAKPTVGVTPRLIASTIGWFMKVESALEGVERATTRGLTNARFGLGPVASGGVAQEFSKNGFGAEGPKDGQGAEGPKDGQGAEGPKDGQGLPFFDASMRSSASIDAGLQQVAVLYRLVAQALRQLEQYVSDLETATAAALKVEGMGRGLPGKSRFDAISLEIDRSFGILSEGAANARRTVRRVVAHPIYGLGPGSVPFGKDAREGLAVRSGLGRRNLLLL